MMQFIQNEQAVIHSCLLLLLGIVARGSWKIATWICRRNKKPIHRTEPIDDMWRKIGEKGGEQ